MEITIIHGQGHRGSTYHITEMMKESLADKDAVVHEYFLPKDAPDFCVGCFQCIKKGEHYCPHAEKVQRILASMLSSRVIIIDSPNYCFEMTGQLKTLFDHFAFMWMSHRPRKEMFSKIGITVSTAAGAGSKKVARAIGKQLFWWGVPEVYSLNFNVNAASYQEVSEQLKQKIAQRVDILSIRIKSRINRSKRNLKTMLFFNVMRKMHISNDWNLVDRGHWENNNWLEGARPWQVI